MTKDYIYDLTNIITGYSTDKSFQLKLCDYFIDELEEKKYRLYIQRAEIYTDMQKYKRAIREYRFAIDSKKNDRFVDGEISYAHHKIACLYYELGNYNKAIEEAKIAVKVNSLGCVFDCFDPAMSYSSDFAKRDLADIYYKTGKYDNAKDTMKEKDFLCFIDSDRILLTKILIAKKDYNKAKKEIDKLKETSNKYVLLAEIEKSKGDVKKAISYYKQAEQVKLDVDEFGGEYIYKEIGNYYKDIGNCDEAIKYYKKIYNYSNNGIALGDYYFENKDYNNAIIYYLETLKKNDIDDRYNKDNAYLFYKLGLSYAELHNTEQANKHFKQANWLEPNNIKYQELVKNYLTPEDIKREKEIEWVLDHHFNRQRDIKKIISNIIDLLLDEYDEIPQEINDYTEKLSGCTYIYETIDGIPVSQIINDFSKCLYKKFQLTNNKLNECLNELKKS